MIVTMNSAQIQSLMCLNQAKLTDNLLLKGVRHKDKIKFVVYTVTTCRIFINNSMHAHILAIIQRLQM